MARFRPGPGSDPAPRPVDPSTVHALCREVLAPGHFVVRAPALLVRHEHPALTLRWEVFQGRLLPPAQTRDERTFASWEVFLRAGGADPGDGGGAGGGGALLGLLLDDDRGELHVVRGVECHAWVPVETSAGVIESREERAWVRELVATLDLATFLDLDDLRDELACLLFRAVSGSRLPLHSVEAPLPAFTFGDLFYLYRGPGGGEEPGRDPAGCWELPAERLATAEVVKRLEFTVRFGPLDAGYGRLAGLPPGEGVRLLRAVYDDISLTPWTDFTHRVRQLVTRLAGEGVWPAESAVDFFAGLLALVARHLTGYDLVTFHYRGANYPDALLVDELLHSLLGWCEHRPDLFRGEAGRLRRRALRQGWLLRTHYAGLPVPDHPTSPGENARVLPDGYPHLSEEDILQPTRRRRALFDGAALPLGEGASAALREACRDLLISPAERRELGAALFLDRPFGGGLAPAEPDGTPLLASLAFSHRIALGRLELLARDGWLTRGDADGLRASCEFPGLPLALVGPPARSGTVGLADAARASADFVFLATRPGSLRSLAALFDLSPLDAFDPALRPLLAGGPALVARALDGAGVVVYDAGQLSRPHPRPLPRLEVEPALGGGYLCRAGRILPAWGLWVARVGDEDVRDRMIALPPT